ncbi:[Genomic island nu Sa beta2] [Staphylococcus aureus]|nr:[Genomic island nu Sa beta2] [Staphylococcus aureus]CUF92918.1 [Genomic island nu Sa beta2] [Staphylococcus aureus]CUF97128.1 [Genomic island nu Sa beta2] [Staphylococcus aureus]
MKRSTNQEKFLDTLIRLNTKIEELGKINILNNHIYSEYFFRDLLNIVYESSPDSCVKCYTMFLPFLLIKIDVFS